MSCLGHLQHLQHLCRISSHFPTFPHLSALPSARWSFLQIGKASISLLISGYLVVCPSAPSLQQKTSESAKSDVQIRIQRQTLIEAFIAELQLSRPERRQQRALLRISNPVRMGGGSNYCEHCHQCDVSHWARTAPEYLPIEPEGELVTILTQANPNFRLTVTGDAAVLVYKNVKDINQQWIKVDVGRGNGGFFDRAGQPGFILVNKATKLPLKHGHQVKDVVTTHEQAYGVNSLEGSIIWSLGKKDEGNGYRGLRTVTNITLNLDVEHGDRAHGGVSDGNRLILSPWKSVANLKWKLEPMETVQAVEPVEGVQEMEPIEGARAVETREAAEAVEQHSPV